MPDTTGQIYPALTLLCVLFTTVGGHYLSVVGQCHTRGSLQDIELTLLVTYNKETILSYNSTENKAIGYTEYGIKWAKDLNSNPQWLLVQRQKGVTECQLYGQDLLTILDTTVQPEVVLSSMRSGFHNHDTVLTCSAYGYFPKGIRVTWVRDGQVLTSGVSTTDELSDGNWHYQVHSYLKYMPTPREKISCMVEHRSLVRPLIYNWDRSLPQSERYKLGFGVAGLILGSIAAASGLIYYRIKQSGRMPDQVSLLREREFIRIQVDRLNNADLLS